MTEEAKRRKINYILDYQRKTYTNISFKVRTKEDQDLIEFLKTVPNKSDFIKNLIRSAMK